MNKKDDMSKWVIGGTTLIGLGVGFIFLKTSGLIFVASILICSITFWINNLPWCTAKV